MYLQKIFTFIYSRCQLFFSCEATKRFIRRTLTLGSFFSLTVYLCVRLIFHDVPFEFLQEAGMILDLLFTGCCLVGLSIAGFNLLMFVADYYSSAVKEQTLAAAIRSIFTPAPAKTLPQQYNVFNAQTSFTIDKNGRLRYVIKVVHAKQIEQDKIFERSNLAKNPAAEEENMQIPATN